MVFGQFSVVCYLLDDVVTVIGVVDAMSRQARSRMFRIQTDQQWLSLAFSHKGTVESFLMVELFITVESFLMVCDVFRTELIRNIALFARMLMMAL